MFDALQRMPVDPILGLIDLFNKDANPHKIDLGVGVYRSEAGETPVLPSVKKAEQWLLENEDSKIYVGPAGNPRFNEAMGKLCLGENHAALADKRCVVMQTPGGCGALRVAAELLKRANSGARVWVSEPSWANHIPLLGNAGLEILHYPYYDRARHAICFGKMLDTLAQAKRDDYVLLHACCHNPSGADLSVSQWHALRDLFQEKGCMPFVDMAYHGFSEGLEADSYGLRMLAEQLPSVIFAVSCSKNFGLYRERVGALGVSTGTSQRVSIVASNIMSIVRGIYSMPPSHGAAVVEHILQDSQLEKMWQKELAGMRTRINTVRRQLVETFNELGAKNRFDYLAQERGMFSFLGLDTGQVESLIKRHSIYMVESSRINVAGLNENNMQRFCQRVLDVL